MQLLWRLRSMVKKGLARVFEDYEMTVQEALVGLSRCGWISSPVLARVEYDNPKLQARRFGKYRIVRCELMSGQRVIVIIITPSESGKEILEQRGENVPPWIPLAAVLKIGEDLVNLDYQSVGRVSYWAPHHMHNNHLGVWSADPELDEKYLRGG